jgi:hypothetical protein
MDCKLCWGELPALPLDLPVFPLANYGSKLLPISNKKELIFSPKKNLHL